MTRPAHGKFLQDSRNTVTRWSPCLNTRATIGYCYLSATSQSYSTSNGLIKVDASDNDNAIQTRKSGSRRKAHYEPTQSRKFRHFTPEEDLQILQLRREGYRWATIAKHLGRSRAVKMRYYNALKGNDSNQNGRGTAVPLLPSSSVTAEPHTGYFTREEDKLIVQLKQSGMHFWGIAKKLGRLEDSVQGRYQWNLKEGAVGSAFGEIKASHFDSLGRKTRKKYSNLDLLTAVHLRKNVGLTWTEIVTYFPERNVTSLKGSWQARWKGMYSDLVKDDPRQWDYEKVKKIIKQGKARRSDGHK